MARGDYTRSARPEKAAAKEEHWLLVRMARDYARGHGIGAKAQRSQHQALPGREFHDVAQRFE